MSDVRVYPFAVNNTVSDTKAAKVVHGLHQLVELGKQAQAALKKLESDGCCPEEIPFVETFHNPIRTSESGKYARLEFVRLPKLIPWSRADLPRLADCTVSLGEISVIVSKGQNQRQASLKVNIHAIEQTDQIGGYKPVEVSCRLGDIRFNKRNLRFVDPNETVYSISRVPHVNKDGIDGLIRMASLLADKFVQLPPKTNESRATHKTLDLRRAASGWLIEEKIIHRLINDIYDLHDVREVLES